MKLLIFSLMACCLPISAAAVNEDFYDMDYVETGHTTSPADTVSIADSLLYLVNEQTEKVKVDSGIPTRYDRRVHRRREHWASLIPTQTVIQYAGNMGFMSVGIGWDYGRHKQWETNLLFGYLPKISSHRGKLTMTLKENYLPWSLYLKRGWMFEPLSCGLYLNTVFGSEFWERQPSRYPDKYYEPLNTKVRINVFLGQRITKIIPTNRRKFLKSVSLFYEVSTCDLYIRLAVMERKVSVWDILGLSLGIKMQIL
ncbi:MAG: hypothetical protein SOZ58_02360 [Prevotella sp.]|nr:hypothetical protein [Prevotella sp.]